MINTIYVYKTKWHLNVYLYSWYIYFKCITILVLLMMGKKNTSKEENILEIENCIYRWRKICIFGKSKQNTLSLWCCVLYLGPICYLNKTWEVWLRVIMMLIIKTETHSTNVWHWHTETFTYTTYHIQARGYLLLTLYIISISSNKQWDISQTGSVCLKVKESGTYWVRIPWTSDYSVSMQHTYTDMLR